jgi:anti-sigma-K factor RskA
MFCMTQSKEGAEILMDYCARTLDPVRKAEVDRHIEVCAECRGMVESQTELWETLDQWQTPPVSPSFNARLYARIAGEEAEPGWRKWARRITHPAEPVAIWKPAVSLAAACAVLAVALTVHAPQPHNPTPQMHADQVDIEQVAKALDDLDILTPFNSM